MKTLVRQRKRARHRSVEPASKMIPATGTAALTLKIIRSFAVFQDYQTRGRWHAMPRCQRCRETDLVIEAFGDPSRWLYVRRCKCAKAVAR